MNREQEKLGAFPYIIGGMSLIPLIGIFFGLAAIVWGLITRKAGRKKLALIGGGGIIFTFVIYSALFYFSFEQRGGIYDDMRSKLSETNIISLVQTIEFYKVQNGHYPESLEVLKKSLPENTMVFFFDPTDVGTGRQPSYYYYELVDSEHYYLLGVGPDGQPFTDDDVIPKIEVGSQSKVGLLIKGR